MLLTQDARDVSKSGVMETAKATIKATPKIFSFFADQTYANKPRAICRELVANAVDSHVMAGKGHEPVEVWLPNLVDPVFKVRDFGLGMSHEFMMGPFMAYTDGSTKDQSNIAIGGFGIGSKSPFAYVDQYTIRSTFDGTMSIYSVFKDDDGIPSIALMAQKSTDDPNGVEVSFPVEPSDFENFREAAFEALKYFEPLPIVRNCGSYKFEEPEYAAKGKTWGMRKTAGPLQVIMGGVMYPVDDSNLTYKFKDETARKMLTYGLDIRVPIGTCSVALSREQLSYDEATIEGLTKACLSVVDELSKSFSTMFDHYPTLWDAKQALYREVYPDGTRYYGGGSVRGKFLAAHALYKGQSLTIEHEFLVPGGMTCWDLEPMQHRRGGKAPNPKWEHYETYALKVQPGAFEHVIIDDLPQTPKSKAVMKIKHFLEQQPQAKRILTVRLMNPDKQKATQVLQALGHPTNYTLTSTLPEPVTIQAQTGGGVARPFVRMFTYTGKKKPWGWNTSNWYDSLMPGKYDDKGVKEIAYADQPKSGILVKLDTWKPPTGFYEKMELGIITWDELHYVNKADYKKLDRTLWKDFEDVFQERLKKKIGAHAGLGEMLAVENAFPEYLKRMFRDIPNALVYPTKRAENSRFAQLETLFRKYVQPIKQDDRKFAPFVKVALPKGVDPDKLWEDFKKKSPRAYRLLELFGYRFSTNEDREFFFDTL